MARRRVRLWPDPVLTQPCQPVDLSDPDLPQLIDDLFETMYAENGRGLAAPQIGVLQQVFVVDVTWKESARAPRVFINPEVTLVQGSETLDEQCLSIPALPMPVTRPEEITLHWTRPDGTQADAPFSGMLARCIQHEADHLQGKVIFDHQSSDDRSKFEAAYAP